jgi:hypothetical protein
MDFATLFDDSLNKGDRNNGHRAAANPEGRMSAISTFRSPAQHPTGLRFVLVNNGMRRMKTECALCGTKIEQSYLRELHTGLLYCDPQCLAGHQRITTKVRMVS